MILNISRQLPLKTIPIFLSSLIMSCASVDRVEFVDATSLVDARMHGDNVPTSAWDQQSPLSTGAAVATALMNDALLKRDLAVIVEHQEEYSKSGLLPNPTISGALGIAIDGMSGAPLVLKGMQGLGWLWTRPDRMASAEASVQQAILSASNRAITLASVVRSGHARVYFSQSKLVLALEDQETSEQAVSLITTLQDAGEATQSDVDGLLLDLAKSKSTVIDRSDDVQKSKLALLASMGIPTWSTDFVVLEPELESMQDTMTEVELLAIATKNRFDLSAKHSKVVQRSAEIGLANPPQITASVAINENFNDREALLAGASVVIQLDGEANEAIADSKLRQAQLELSDALRIVLHEVRQALQESRSAGDKLQISQNEIVNLAKAQHDRALQLEEQGEMDPLSIILIKRQFIAADVLVLTHLQELTVAQIKLQLAVGGTFKASMPTEVTHESHPSKGLNQ